MSSTSQKRALENHRRRQQERGIGRYEVRGLEEDKELIRVLAKRLAENDADAARLRAEMRRTIAGEPPRKGGILAALRRSPLVGADLDLSREATTGRDVDL